MRQRHLPLVALALHAFSGAPVARAQATWLEMTSSCANQLPTSDFTVTDYCSMNVDNFSVTYPSRHDELSVEYLRTLMSNANDTVRERRYGDEQCIAALRAEQCSNLFSRVVCFNLFPPCVYCSTYYDELATECPNSYAACVDTRADELEALYQVDSLLNQYSCEGSGWRWRGRTQRWIEPPAERCKDYAVDAWPDGCVKDDGSVFDANTQSSAASSMVRGGVLAALAALV